MIRSHDDIRCELLVVRCRRQDAEAWKELVGLFHDRLYYFVRRMVSDDDAAAVVMQEVWMQVLAGLGRLRASERLTPWLYTIARRMVVNRYRREVTEPANSGEPLEDAPDESREAFEQFENAELVHFGLSRLAVEDREILTLHFLEDFSVAEIVRILEIPEGTVKSRLFKARCELRHVLEREASQRPKGVRS